MFTPCPRRKPPIIDLCKSSPTCPNISIRVSDVTTNSEKSRDDEGIIDLEDDDYTIDILEDLIIQDDDDVETLSDTTDAMDESTESDDDVVVTGEMHSGDAWTVIQNWDANKIHNGDATVIQNGDTTVIQNGNTTEIQNGEAFSSPLRTTSPSLLSASLRRMMSPSSGCECRPLKTYSGKRPSEAVARTDGHPGASSSTPLAPGGKSSLSPTARARLISSSPPTGIRSQHTPVDRLSPVAHIGDQASPLANAFPVDWLEEAPDSAVLQSTENLRVPQLVYRVPNSEIGEETVEKYQLKNFSIHLSKTKCTQAIAMQRKVNFLEYFGISLRSNLNPPPPNRVQPLVIGGLNKRYPHILKKQIAQKKQRKRSLNMERKSFRGLENPTRNQPQVLKNVVFN